VESQCSRRCSIGIRGGGHKRRRFWRQRPGCAAASSVRELLPTTVPGAPCRRAVAKRIVELLGEPACAQVPIAQQHARVAVAAECVRVDERALAGFCHARNCCVAQVVGVPLRNAGSRAGANLGSFQVIRGDVRNTVALARQRVQQHDEVGAQR
jgi:hypothetical protein